MKHFFITIFLAIQSLFVSPAPQPAPVSVVVDQPVQGPVAPSPVSLNVPVESKKRSSPTKPQSKSIVIPTTPTPVAAEPTKEVASQPSISIVVTVPEPQEETKASGVDPEIARKQAINEQISALLTKCSTETSKMQVELDNYLKAINEVLRDENSETITHDEARDKMAAVKTKYAFTQGFTEKITETQKQCDKEVSVLRKQL